MKSSGELRSEESLQDLLVRGIGEGEGIEVVLLHKLIEDVRAEHHRLGYLHRGVGILVELGMALDDVVEKGQSASFATQ